MDTGDTGRIRIRDKTDEADKLVEFWVQSLSPIGIPQLPWAFSVGDVQSEWRPYNFQNTTIWQQVGVIHVGDSSVETVTLHLGNTGTSQLGGPTDLEINLFSYIQPEDPENPPEPGEQSPVPRYANITVGNVVKKAIPYVNVAGVWKPALTFHHGANGWKEIA